MVTFRTSQNSRCSITRRKLSRVKLKVVSGFTASPLRTGSLSFRSMPEAKNPSGASKTRVSRSRYPASHSPKSHIRDSPSTLHRPSPSRRLNPATSISVMTTSEMVLRAELLRSRYRTSTVPSASFSVTRSRATASGARRSASSTGLKLIQKLARTGKITITATIRSGGSSIMYASRISWAFSDDFMASHPAPWRSWETGDRWADVRSWTGRPPAVGTTGSWPVPRGERRQFPPPSVRRRYTRAPGG